MTPNDQHRIDQETIETLAAAVSKAMEQNHGSKRYLDLERIPLICLAISNISKALDEIKEMMENNRRESYEQHKNFVTKGGEYLLIRAIVFGGVSLVLLAFAKVAIDSFIK